MGQYKINSLNHFNFTHVGTRYSDSVIKEPESERCMSLITSQGNNAGYSTLSCDAESDSFSCDYSQIEDEEPYRGNIENFLGLSLTYLHIILIHLRFLITFF